MQPPSRTARAQGNISRISNFDGKELFRYSRFDGGDRPGKVDLGQWKSHRHTFFTGRDNTPGCRTLAEIETATTICLGRRDVQRDLKEVAKIWVERRGVRTRNESDWDRYASFSCYECDLKGSNAKKVLNTAPKFKEHNRRNIAPA